jgi:hypothetical protein
LYLLLAAYFPNSFVVERGAAPAAACRTKCLDWRVAAMIVTYQGVGWAIDSIAPYEGSGMDGIFPVLLKEGREVLIPYLIRIFRTCLATGYVPAMWRQVKVVFIPKPGRNSYCGPKNFRPISLTSFLLKTMERLVDRFLRDEIFVIEPLNPNQHAYQAGKSVESALLQLVVRVEKALDQQQIALGIFLDIEGGFNNTSYNSVCGICQTWSGSYHRTIRATLEGRQARATLGGLSRSVAVSRGCAQESVLSPLLWCLVFNELLTRLSEGCVYVQGYADICLLAVVKFPNTVSGFIQRALHTVEAWLDELGLSVNPDKTGLVVFTRKRNFRGSLSLDLEGPYNAPCQSSIWE